MKYSAAKAARIGHIGNGRATLSAGPASHLTGLGGHGEKLSALHCNQGSAECQRGRGRSTRKPGAATTGPQARTPGPA